MTTLSRGAAVSSLMALAMALPEITYAQDLSVTVGGRINADYTIADLDDPDGDIDGSELRRARITISGYYGNNIEYKFELQTDSDGDVYAEDAFLQFGPGNSGIKFIVGQQRTTNSLDEQTSSRFTSTIERASLTDAFGLDRRLGVSVTKLADNYTLSAGVFSENLEGTSFDTEGRAASARGTFNPINTSDTMVHLGASWRYRSGGESSEGTDELLRYRQRPFTHQTNDRIVSTSRFAKSDNFFGVEAAAMQGPFWAAAEYSALSANGGDENADADFAGYYGEVGMFFGGSRNYSAGEFGRPNVDNPITEGGKGAFSIVARYDALDLDDAAFDQKLNTVILGADWYPTRHTRFGINYFNADADNGSFGAAEGIVSRLYFDF